MTDPQMPDTPAGRIAKAAEDFAAAYPAQTGDDTPFEAAVGALLDLMELIVTHAEFPHATDLVPPPPPPNSEP